MRSLLITSEAVTRAALMREESRGAHTRDDFPGESEEWVKYNVVVQRGAGRRDGGREAQRARGRRSTSSRSPTRRSKISSPARSAPTRDDWR